MLLPVQVTTLNFFWKKVFIRISPTKLIEMSNWEEIYLDFDSNELAQQINQIKGVIVGFNVNIDKIIEVNPEVLRNILSAAEYKISYQKEENLTTIDNIEDFFFFLLQAIAGGKADEKLLFSKDVHLWIENEFDIKQTKLGGQAGIMANLLRRMEVKQILLSLPIFDKTLLKLLDSSIQVIVKENNDYTIKPVENVESNETSPIVHYVFEFKEGNYTVYDQIIECKRANRFIVSYDLVNSQLKIHKGFYKYSEDNVHHYSLAIVSGFHLVNPNLDPSKTHLDLIKPVSDLIAKWKLSNPELTIHFEVAATEEIQLKAVIISEIIPSVDSIGLNEQELLDFIKIIDSSTYYLLKKEISAVNLFKGLLSLLREYPHLRIHLHYLGFYLVLSSPITKEQARKRRKSLIYASIHAAKKVELCETVLNDISSDFNYTISKEGKEQLISLDKHLSIEYEGGSDFFKSGYFTATDFTLVGIPSIVAKKPKSLVGLGDTISLISVLFDNI